MQARLCGRARQSPRAIELTENIGEPITDQVEHSEIGHAQCYLGADPLSHFILDADGNFNGIPRPIVFAIRRDIHCEQLFLRTDAEADVANLESRPATT